MALGDKSPVVMGKEKGAAGGVATLGADGILAEAQRPSAAEILTLNGKSVEEALKSAGLPTGGLEGQALVKAGADSETPTKWGPWPSNPNLLINGDFRKPVNRNGKSKYTTIGNHFQCIDRWFLYNSSCTILENGVDFVGSFAQETNHKEIAGKLCTLSIFMSDGTLIYGSAIYPTYGNVSIQNIIGKTDKLAIAQFEYNIHHNYQPSILIEKNSNYMASFIAIKLELGDQQTLAHKDENGNWVLNDPPDYDLQYLLCSQYSPSTGEFVGSQHSNLNLLDNPDFAIWQRYPTGVYEGVPGNNFIPDRYQFAAASNVSTTLKRIAGGGIYCKSGSRCQISYKDENATTYAGKTMTLSCLSSKGLQTDTKIMPTNLSAETNLFGLFEHYLTWIYPEETKYRYKLELGPVQTLAHKDENGNWILNDPPPNKDLELAKCQRYFRNLKFGDNWNGYLIQTSNDGTRLLLNLFLGTPMRIDPAIVKVNVWDYSTGNSQDVVVDWKYGSNLLINSLHLSSPLTASKEYVIQELWLSADL